ncbi:Similar to Rufy2: RUN and FYVE domain-containing protein 2 (Mus musculus) [Cotesia congregata]|uniref:Similar to Rufy2: RUN and FYVE domain-containing protein 2 (Mus musculus) n=1 Tax=Cotesia congregata TaxID=51543 RepID=A0A8J2EKC3_COTCN|nr:Similar to Rufy2: RUN and FYVE domain-containing protein 2 (Mus musculus) [Cotesia congregata]
MSENTSAVSPSDKSLSGSMLSDDIEGVSRSPSTYSIREDKWPDLVVSRPRKLDAWWSPRRAMIDQDMAGAQDTIYLCNFRVSVDGEWLCLKELQDVEFSMQDSMQRSPSPPLAISARDPVIIERSNLVNISKLIVKELIETSLKYGRMLDSDHMPLQHFFIVLEHVLRHGLRPKKGLLGPKKELWDILQLVEKYCPEAQDITASIRDLPTVRTAMGRARAWLRMALMQKKLADYLKILIDHRDDLLSEYFEPDALMMSEEAIVIMGLLVGLNVIDCNFCVKKILIVSKGATVKNLQAKVESLTTTNALMKEDLSIARNNILSIQEENRQLKKELGIEVKDTVETGKTPIKITETTSEIEELRSRLESEKKLRSDVEKELALQVSMKSEMEVAMKLLEKDIHEKQDTIISLRRQLEDIKLINLEMYKKLQECEVELTQKGEMVSRLHAKTNQIGKILNNLEKYNHLMKDSDGRTPTTPSSTKSFVKISPLSPKPPPFAELGTFRDRDFRAEKAAKDCESSLKHKTEVIVKLEAQTLSMSETIQKMDQKCKEIDNVRSGSEERARLLDAKVAEREARANGMERELKVEREWRTSLQEASVSNTEKISQLLQEIDQLKSVHEKYLTLQEEHYALREICTEQERTLEELGGQLSLAKLAACELREAVDNAQYQAANNEGTNGTPTWANDRLVTNCKGCNREFNLTRRKHHCRNCGKIFCNACSDNTIALPNSAKPVRVCDECHVFLVGRYSVLTP